MANITSHPPEEHLPLCEQCGYILQGLDVSAVCPECGSPVARSVDPKRRQPCGWDLHRDPLTFVMTSWTSLVAPSRFFAHLATRSDANPASWFAVIWRVICSVLLSLALSWHLNWLENQPMRRLASTAVLPVPVRGLSLLWIYFGLALVNVCAARFTAWEARYRNLRLPLIAVRRGLDYHSVHLFPVALVAVLTVGLYPHALRSGILGPAASMMYLYVLCGEVVLGAAYLFFTYWAAMRNMLFANR